MISYEEALAIARGLYDGFNYVTEETDAFIFSERNDNSLGGNSPAVVIKDTGECIMYTVYITGGYNRELVEEKPID